MTEVRSSSTYKCSLRLIVVASLLLYLVALVIAWKMYNSITDISTLYIFYKQFIVHEVPGAALGAAILLACLLWRVPLAWVNVILAFMTRHRLSIAAIFTALTSVGALEVYHNLPLTIDEFAPFFQAQVFAAGEVTGKIPPDMLNVSIPFVGKWFLADYQTGQVISSYWPGYALLLTPFVFLNIPWLLNPLLGGVSLLLVWKLATEVFESERAGGWAVLLMVSSSVFPVIAMSYYSMTAHMACNLLYALLLLQPGRKNLFFAGIVGSVALSLHNPFPHFLFAVPFVLWLALQPGRVSSLAVLAAGYLPLTFILVGGYFYLKVSVAGSIVNHEGLAQSQSIMDRISGLAPGKLSLPTLKIIFWRLIGIMKLHTWGVPCLLMLGLCGAFTLRKNRMALLLALAAATTLGGYFFGEVSQGHGWGYRYFHSALFTLPVLAAGLILHFKDTQQNALFTQFTRFIGTVAIASLLVLTPLRLYQVDAFITQHLTQRPQVDEEKAQVAFIRLPGYHAIDLLQNDPFLRGKTLYLRSSGPEFEEKLMRRHFPEAKRRNLLPDDPVWNLDE